MTLQSTLLNLYRPLNAPLQVYLQWGRPRGLAGIEKDKRLNLLPGLNLLQDTGLDLVKDTSLGLDSKLDKETEEAWRKAHKDKVTLGKCYFEFLNRSQIPFIASIR